MRQTRRPGAPGRPRHFRSSSMALKLSRAVSRSAVISPAMRCGAGRLADSSSASSFSQKMSRFTLSRLVSSSYVNALNRSLSRRSWRFSRNLSLNDRPRVRREFQQRRREGTPPAQACAGCGSGPGRRSHHVWEEGTVSTSLHLRRIHEFAIDMSGLCTGRRKHAGGRRWNGVAGCGSRRRHSTARSCLSWTKGGRWSAPPTGIPATCGWASSSTSGATTPRSPANWPPGSTSAVGRPDR